MVKILSILLVSVLLLSGSGWGAETAGVFGGVGVDGAPRADGTILVKQLVLGGPAQLAGIKAGDIITQIDGTPTAGRDFKFLVERRLRGRSGTPVLLVVKRTGSQKPLVFKLVRRQLKPPAVGKKQQSKGE